jgi:hypothetical protein
VADGGFGVSHDRAHPVARDEAAAPVADVADREEIRAQKQRAGTLRLLAPDLFRLEKVQNPTRGGRAVALRASAGSLVGEVWRKVADAHAAGGEALETAVRTPPRPAAGYAEYRFEARAGTEYHVWVRARTLDAGDGTSRAPAYPHAGMVRLDALSGDWLYTTRDRTHRTSMIAWAARLSLPGPYFNGFRRGKPAHRYVWSGGPADPTDLAYRPWRLRLRFWKNGTQTLRLYPADGPLRVDTILLSAERNARP